MRLAYRALFFHSFGLFFRYASRSMVGITDSRRLRSNRGRSKSDILVTASPSNELNGATKVAVSLHLVSLEGGIGRAVLFLILTIVDWRGGGSSDKARKEFCGPRETSLLFELAREGVIEKD